MAYVFTVNGVTKDIQPGWMITESANSRNRMDFDYLLLTGSGRLVNDDEVILTDSGTRIFAGLVDNPGEAGLGGFGSSSAIVQKIGAADYSVYASRITVGSDVSRPSESLSARLSWVAGLLSAQGVTLSGSQLTGPTLGAATYLADRFLVDVLNEITSVASSTGSTSWVWDIDYNKNLIARESGTYAAPVNITDGDGNVFGDMTVLQPRPSTFGNYIIVLGGTGTRDVADNFTGNGGSTFTLTYSLSASYGYVTYNGIFETLGTGATWTYDPPTNTITRSSPTSVGAPINITYIAQFPKRVISDSGVSAANRIQKLYVIPDVYDAVVLQSLADSFLARDSASPKTVRYSSNYTTTGFHPGQSQTITSTKRNLSGSFLITEVRIINVAGLLVQRQITAVSSLRLPATLREQYQQTVGGIVTNGGAATGITVISGGTYLSSPASLGGSDITWRACNSPTRVPNAQPYDASSALAVTVKGLVSSQAAQNVTVHLWDGTTNSSTASQILAANQTPTTFSFSASLVSGHRYWLYVAAGTANISATACGQLTS